VESSPRVRLLSEVRLLPLPFFRLQCGTTVKDQERWLPVLLVEAHKCTKPELPKVRAISQAHLSLPGSTYPDLNLVSSNTSLHPCALCRLHLTRRNYRSGEVDPEDVTLLGNLKVGVRHL
jgi:hypothetical protein